MDVLWGHTLQFYARTMKYNPLKFTNFRIYVYIHGLYFHNLQKYEKKRLDRFPKGDFRKKTLFLFFKRVPGGDVVLYGGEQHLEAQHDA